MFVQLSDTSIRVGDVKTIQAEIGFDSLRWSGNEYPITDRKPAVLKIGNQGSDKYHLEAEIDCVLHMPCDRCLTDVPCRVSIQSEHDLIAHDDPEYESEDPDEQLFLHGYELDADEYVRNELFVHIPMKVLCREDCKGLCPVCGIDLNHSTCNCQDGPRDPRMAAIQDLFKNANLQG